MSENRIIIDGVDVSTCRNITFEHHNGKVTRFIVCECGLQDVEYYNMMCSDNPDCYYKQLQRITTQYNKILEQYKASLTEIYEATALHLELKKRDKNLQNTLAPFRKVINQEVKNERQI